MSHELCLYRSDAARQGSVVLLLKISMVLMKKLMALLSHSEAFAPLLLEVAEFGGQLPSKPGCLLQACRNKACSARHKRVHARLSTRYGGLGVPQLIDDSERSIELVSRSYATCDPSIGA
jgi:hypothetical protein